MSDLALELDETTMTIRFHGWMRFWAFKRTLTIPREAVVTATPLAEMAEQWPRRTLRMGGSLVPGKVAAGRFLKPGKPRVRSFWAMYDPTKAIRFDLRDHTYAYLVFQVNEVDSELNRLREWING